MNNLDKARIAMFDKELRKQEIKENIKKFTKTLEYYLKHDPNNNDRNRIEGLLIRQEQLLATLEN